MKSSVDDKGILNDATHKNTMHPLLFNRLKYMYPFTDKIKKTIGISGVINRCRR